MAQFMRSDLVVRELSSGHRLTVPVFRYKGQGKGPTVYIQSSIHGAEVQGNGVIFELMRYLQEIEPEGDVILVPQCNPVGQNQKMGEYTQGRFDPTTGDNWNRNHFYLTGPSKEALSLQKFVEENRDKDFAEIKVNFKKAMAQTIKKRIEHTQTWGEAYGKLLCLKLQEIACEADIVLDLHTASLATHYVYAPTYAEKAAAQLGFPHVLLIPEAFAGAMDEASFVPWWDMKEAFLEVGRDVPVDFVGLTVELASQESLNLDKAAHEAQKIINFLRAQGVFSAKAPDLVKEKRETVYGCFLEHYKNLFAPCGGLAQFKVRPGEHVKKGQVLAQILNLQGIKSNEDLKGALRTVASPADGIIINIFPSAIVMEGHSLFLMMTEVRELKTET